MWYDRGIDSGTAFYGQGADMAGDGSAMGWKVWIFHPDTGSSVLVAVSVVKTEDGVRLTFRDLERYQAPDTMLAKKITSSICVKITNKQLTFLI